MEYNYKCCIACAPAKVARGHNFPLLCSQIYKGESHPCIMLLPEYVQRISDSVEKGDINEEVINVTAFGFPADSPHIDKKALDIVLQAEKRAHEAGEIIAYKEEQVQPLP